MFAGELLDQLDIFIVKVTGDPARGKKIMKVRVTCEINRNVSVIIFLASGPDQDCGQAWSAVPPQPVQRGRAEFVCM